MKPTMGVASGPREAGPRLERANERRGGAVPPVAGQVGPEGGDEAAASSRSRRPVPASHRLGPAPQGISCTTSS